MTASTQKTMSRSPLPHKGGNRPTPPHLDDLREAIRALEGRTQTMLTDCSPNISPFLTQTTRLGATQPPTMPQEQWAHQARLGFGIEAIDTCLGGGLISDALHEVFPNRPEWDDGLTSAFALALLSCLQTSGLGHLSTAPGNPNSNSNPNPNQSRSLRPEPGAGPGPRPIVWITQRDTAGATLSPQGLMALGFNPDALFQIETKNDADALWAFEEMLNHPDLGAAVVELCHLDLAQSHRIQLRAQETQRHGRFRLLMLLRRNKGARQPQAHPTSAATRWRLGPIPPQRLAIPNITNREQDMDGQYRPITSLVPKLSAAPLSRVRWSAQLFRQRGGAPADWFLEWSYEAQRFRQLARREQTQKQPL